MPILNDKKLPDEERELIDDWEIGGGPAPALLDTGSAGQALRRLQISEAIRDYLAGVFVRDI